MPVLNVDKPLRDKLGDEAVDSLVRLINQSLSDQKNNTFELVEKKFEYRLSEEIGKVRIEVGNIRNDMYKMKSDLIKWMFIFWVGQVGAFLGILFAFFR